MSRFTESKEDMVLARGLSRGKGENPGLVEVRHKAEARSWILSSWRRARAKARVKEVGVAS